jgi:hypothetical protein
LRQGGGIIADQFYGCNVTGESQFRGTNGLGLGWDHKSGGHGAPNSTKSRV